MIDTQLFWEQPIQEQILKYLQRDYDGYRAYMGDSFSDLYPLVSVHSFAGGLQLLTGNNYSRSVQYSQDLTNQFTRKSFNFIFRVTLTRLNKTDKKNSFLFTVKVAPSLIQAHLAVTKFSSFVFNTMAEKLYKENN